MEEAVEVLKDHLVAVRKDLEQNGDPDAYLDDDIPLLDVREPDWPSVGLDERIRQAVKAIQVKNLQHLFDQVSQQLTYALALSEQQSPNRIKETLKLLIGLGSPFIASAALSSRFEEQIRACKSRDALVRFLQGLLDDWDEVFKEERQAVPPTGVGSNRN
jgi:hypothetical protein